MNISIYNVIILYIFSFIALISNTYTTSDNNSINNNENSENLEHSEAQDDFFQTMDMDSLVRGSNTLVDGVNKPGDFKDLLDISIFGYNRITRLLAQTKSIYDPLTPKVLAISLGKLLQINLSNEDLSIEQWITRIHNMLEIINNSFLNPPFKILAERLINHCELIANTFLSQNNNIEYPNDGIVTVNCLMEYVVPHPSGYTSKWTFVTFRSLLLQLSISIVMCEFQLFNPELLDSEMTAIENLLFRSWDVLEHYGNIQFYTQLDGSSGIMTFAQSNLIPITQSYGDRTNISWVTQQNSEIDLSQNEENVQSAGEKVSSDPPFYDRRPRTYSMLSDYKRRLSLTDTLSDEEQQEEEDEYEHEEEEILVENEKDTIAKDSSKLAKNVFSGKGLDSKRSFKSDDSYNTTSSIDIKAKITQRSSQNDKLSSTQQQDNVGSKPIITSKWDTLRKSILKTTTQEESNDGKKGLKGKISFSDTASLLRFRTEPLRWTEKTKIEPLMHKKMVNKCQVEQLRPLSIDYYNKISPPGLGHPILGRATASSSSTLLPKFMGVGAKINKTNTTPSLDTLSDFWGMKHHDKELIGIRKLDSTISQMAILDRFSRLADSCWDITTGKPSGYISPETMYRLGGNRKDDNIDHVTKLYPFNLIKAYRFLVTEEEPPRNQDSDSDAYEFSLFMQAPEFISILSSGDRASSYDIQNTLISTIKTLNSGNDDPPIKVSGYSYIRGGESVFVNDFGSKLPDTILEHVCKIHTPSTILVHAKFTDSKFNKPKVILQLIRNTNFGDFTLKFVYKGKIPDEVIQENRCSECISGYYPIWKFVLLTISIPLLELILCLLILSKRGIKFRRFCRSKTNVIQN